MIQEHVVTKSLVLALWDMRNKEELTFQGKRSAVKGAAGKLRIEYDLELEAKSLCKGPLGLVEAMGKVAHRRLVLQPEDVGGVYGFLGLATARPKKVESSVGLSI